MNHNAILLLDPLQHVPHDDSMCRFDGKHIQLSQPIMDVDRRRHRQFSFAIHCRAQLQSDDHHKMFVTGRQHQCFIRYCLHVKEIQLVAHCNLLRWRFPGKSANRLQPERRTTHIPDSKRGTQPTRAISRHARIGCQGGHIFRHHFTIHMMKIHVRMLGRRFHALSLWEMTQHSTWDGRLP